MKRFLGIILISSVFLTLCGLSAWQFQRREWKNQLLETLATNGGKLPLALTDILPLPEAQQWYRPVLLEGTMLWDKSLRVGLRQQDGQVGYWIITPMQSDAGYFLVIAGFLSLQESRDWAPPAPDFLRLSGRILPVPAPTWFTPANDPEQGTWYTLNSQEIGHFLKLEPMLPTIIIADTLAGFSPVTTPTTLRNQHLQYALTWAFLAFLLILYVFFYRRRS